MNEHGTPADSARRMVDEGRIASHSAVKEPPLPFYLGVRQERRIGWWQRWKQRRALRAWIRAGRPS